MRTIIRSVIGSSVVVLVLLLCASCERSSRTASTQYVPEYKIDTLNLSVEENQKLAEWYTNSPELIKKIKAHSDANAVILKSHNEFARKHNIEALKSGHVPDFIIQRAYPELKDSDTNKDKVNELTLPSLTKSYIVETDALYRDRGGKIVTDDLRTIDYSRQVIITNNGLGMTTTEMKYWPEGAK